MISALLLTSVHAAEVFWPVADCDAYLLCGENQIKWWVDVNYGEICEEVDRNHMRNTEESEGGLSIRILSHWKCTSKPGPAE